MLGGTPRGSPRGARTPRSARSTYREQEKLEASLLSEGSRATQPEALNNLQLAIIPEHGVQALVTVDPQPKAKAKQEDVVFPSFMGKAPKPLQQDESGKL